MDNLLLYGTAYYDEYIPTDRIQEDFKLMQAAGMNVIRIAESTWSCIEPEDGVFDFSHLHRMLDACTQFGMYAIIGTPTYAVPSWLVHKYPDILAETFNGPSLYGHRQNMNLLNKDYLFHAKRMICRLMEESQAYSCVIGFQLDNETKSYDTAGPDVQAEFVARLKQQFPDIHDFNEQFGLNFWSNSIASWDDFPDIRGSINGSLVAEFRKFQRQIVSEFLMWQSEIVHSYIRPEQFITQNFDYSWIGHSFGYQPETDQFKAANAVSVAGVDIYHPTGSHLTGAEIAFGGCIGRALKKAPYLVLETQAQGPIGYLPYPGQLRLQAYSHLGSGAHMIEYWHWHSIHNSFESYWRGVLSHNLKPGVAYQEISMIGNELKKLGSSVLISKKEKSIAILLSNEALTGLNEFPISKDFTYNHILRWIFDALYELNYECDFLSADDDSFHTYPVVITPALYSLSDTMCQSLSDYVQKGGHLISTFKTAFSDDFIKIYHDEQPHGLTKCFGMTYDLFSPPDHASLLPDFCNGSFAVSQWMEFLIPDTAKVLAKYQLDYENDYAAITENQYGDGLAFYLGCYFDKEVLKKFLTLALTESGLPASDAVFPIIVKRGENLSNQKLIYIFNYSNQKQSLNLNSVLNVEEKKHQYLEIFSSKVISLKDQLCISAWNLVLLVDQHK